MADVRMIIANEAPMNPFAKMMTHIGDVWRRSIGSSVPKRCMSTWLTRLVSPPCTDQIQRMA